MKVRPVLNLTSSIVTPQVDVGLVQSRDSECITNMSYTRCLISKLEPLLQKRRRPAKTLSYKRPDFMFTCVQYSSSNKHCDNTRILRFFDISNYHYIILRQNIIVCLVVSRHT